jgi:hypothetical protein
MRSGTMNIKTTEQLGAEVRFRRKQLKATRSGLQTPGMQEMAHAGNSVERVAGIILSRAASLLQSLARIPPESKEPTTNQRSAFPAADIIPPDKGKALQFGNGGELTMKLSCKY